MEELFPIFDFFSIISNSVNNVIMDISIGSSTIGKNIDPKSPERIGFFIIVITIEMETTETTNTVSIPGNSLAIANPWRIAEKTTGNIFPPVHPVFRHISRKISLMADKLNRTIKDSFIPISVTRCRECCPENRRLGNNTATIKMEAEPIKVFKITGILTFLKHFFINFDILLNIDPKSIPYNTSGKISHSSFLFQNELPILVIKEGCPVIFMSMIKLISPLMMKNETSIFFFFNSIALFSSYLYRQLSEDTRHFNFSIKDNFLILPAL